MTQGTRSGDEALNECLVNHLNAQGFPFQQRALFAGRSVFDKGDSPWRFEVQEFPVQVRGRDVHIDFVLKHKSCSAYIVAECKRANPAYSSWCFVRYAYSGDPSDDKATIVDGVADGIVRPRLLKLDETQYHLGIEMKSGKSGDPNPSYGAGKGIEDAATQVCRGMNGLVHTIRYVLQDGHKPETIVIPVVITTARLHASNLDLFQTDLATGNIEVGSSTLTEVKWLAFRYHQSESIRHQDFGLCANQTCNLRTILTGAYARTIYVVNAMHVEEFLIHAGQLVQ